MKALIPIDEAELPVERRYRPKGAGRWSRLVVLVAGAAIAVVTVADGAPAWLRTVILVGSGVAIVGTLWWMVHVVRLNARWIGARLELERYLGSGELTRAEELLEMFCRRARAVAFVHAEAVWRLGMVSARRGDLERAAALVYSAQHGRILKLYPTPNGEADLLADLGFVQALRGQLEAAQTTQRALNDIVSREQRAGFLLIDAAIAARAGQWQELVDMVDTRWAGAESCLSPHQARAVMTLKAFAIEHLRSDLRSEPHDTDLDRALERARPVHDGELDYLGTEWPDLAEFLHRHLRR